MVNQSNGENETPSGRGHVSWAQHIRAVLSAAAVGGSSSPSHTRPKARDADISTFYEPNGIYAAHAKEDGDGPVIAFIHGSPGSADGWVDYLIDPTIPGTKMAIDRPGFGASGFARGDETLPQQARALGQLLKDRPAILVGHSFGGPVALQAAHDLEKQIQGVLLVATAADPVLERILAIQHFGEWPGVRNMLPRIIRSANRELIALPHGLAELGPKLAKITAHISVIHSDDDVLVPFENVAYLKRELRDCASFVEQRLTGRNHFLPWNSYDEVSQQLIDLIARSTGKTPADRTMQHGNGFEHV